MKDLKGDLMRITFVLDYFTPHIGGAETLFDSMTSRLAEKGFEISIVTQKVPESKKTERSRGRLIRRVSPDFRHAFPLTSFATSAEEARKSDLVHFATLGGLGAGLLLKKAVKKPVVATFFEVWGDLFFKFQRQPQSGINFLLEKIPIMGYRNDNMVSISRHTKEKLVEGGVPSGNVTVIYPGIDKGLFTPKAGRMFDFDFPVFMAFGRPGVSKGIPYLVRAVPKIVENIPDAKLLLMISKDPYGEYQKIVNLVKSVGAEDNVIITQSQKRNDVPKVINSCDVVVVPSLSEGFGFSAAEAMACGKPVVASDVASLKEIVSNKSGLLAAPGNPLDFAEKITKILEDGKLQARLGKGARKDVKKFDWNRNVREHIKLYERIVE